MSAAISSFWLNGWAVAVNNTGILIAPSATISLEVSDDYASTEFRGLQFINTANKWAQHVESLDLTGATPHLYIQYYNKQIFIVTGAVIQATTPDQKLAFDVLAVDTSKLGSYRGRDNVNYSVRVTMPNGHVITAIEGKVLVS